MIKIKFEHKKEFGTPTGAIITMKKLITFNYPDLKCQYVECYENNNRYKASELTPAIS